ncbi:hypothetical protein PC117_g5980 [Phytophthora cactorum]|uniref:Uncharacterized protein n=1 Tax=Phytophthora cactorum TaxID=29920 RepID=A0A8T1E2U1_9STRA|nr:hypothetical protein PC117_g5980 [Phytophthora cactorum]
MELSESEVGQRDHRVGPTTLEVAIQERRVEVSGRIIGVVIAVQEVVLDDVVVDQAAVLGEAPQKLSGVYGGGTLHHCSRFDKEWNIITYPCRVLRRLHNQLLSLQTINFETHMNAEDLVPVPIPRQKHTLVNTE